MESGCRRVPPEYLTDGGLEAIRPLTLERLQGAVGEEAARGAPRRGRLVDWTGAVSMLVERGLVDGSGVARRCHFIAAPIGNIYEDGFEHQLRPQPCTQALCGCHIGYVHRPELELYELFGDGVLERIPMRSCSRARRA